jgi:hypothetical protein
MAIQKKASQGKVVDTRQQGSAAAKKKPSMIETLESMQNLRESLNAPVKVPQLVDESPSEKILAILDDLEPEKRNDTVRGVINALCLRSFAVLKEHQEQTTRAENAHDELLEITGRRILTEQ